MINLYEQRANRVSSFYLEKERKGVLNPFVDGDFCLLDYMYVSYSLLDKHARTVFFSSMTRCAEEEEGSKEKNVKISETEWTGLSLYGGVCRDKQPFTNILHFKFQAQAETKRGTSVMS